MATRPNILIIQSDQHRHDCVGYRGLYPIKTPHLDRLAAEGVQFRHAYTPIPTCCPARQALLQGRRPESFGALWNYDLGLPIYSMQANDYSWPRQLQSNGYRTAYFGKWHASQEHDPTAFGFDHYVSDAQFLEFVQDKYGQLHYENGYNGESSPLPLEDSDTHYMTKSAIEWLQIAPDDQPWHVRLDFQAPHLPCRPSEPFASMYKPEDIPQWPNFEDSFAHKPYIQEQQLWSWGIEQMSWQDWSKFVALYYGYISQMDDAIGQMLHALEQMGIAEDTMVIYTSDHGDMCGAHRMMDKHYIMYDDVVRIPMLMRWPDVIAAGTIHDEFVYNMLDLPPTLLEAAGEDVPNFFHGKSLWPLLNGDAEGWREAAVTTYNGQQFGLYTQRMWRTKDWKYIWSPTDVDELYELSTDPHELHNVIGRSDLQEMVAGFRQQLYAELVCVGDGAVDGEWMKRQLTENRKIVR